MDLLATRRRDHVMEGWDVPVQRRQSRAIRRVRVHDGGGLRYALVNVVMHAPLARRHVTPGVVPAEVHEHDMRWRHLLIRDPRGCHQEATFDTARSVARSALVDPHSVHGQARLDDLVALLEKRQRSVAARPAAPSAAGGGLQARRRGDGVPPLEVAEGRQLGRLLAIRLELGQHHLHLVVRQHNRWRSSRQSRDELLREALGLVR
mmetsp:Transcript_24446/g.73417  ORF Transcript_24446/g.73417 Transcript_24446/m.73417 type:complete len:206 (-) Transcript_24446:661-1278(-)